MSFIVNRIQNKWLENAYPQPFVCLSNWFEKFEVVWLFIVVVKNSDGHVVHVFSKRQNFIFFKKISYMMAPAVLFTGLGFLSIHARREMLCRPASRLGIQSSLRGSLLLRGNSQGLQL